MNRLKSFYTLHNWNGEKLLAVFGSADYWKIGDYQYHTLQVCHWEQCSRISQHKGFACIMKILNETIKKRPESQYKTHWFNSEHYFLKSYYYQAKTIFTAKTREDVKKAMDADYEKLRKTHNQAIFESFWNWKNCHLAPTARQ